jgi:hypothetical protein
MVRGILSTVALHTDVVPRIGGVGFAADAALDRGSR